MNEVAEYPSLAEYLEKRKQQAVEGTRHDNAD